MYSKLTLSKNGVTTILNLTRDSFPQPASTVVTDAVTRE